MATLFSSESPKGKERALSDVLWVLSVVLVVVPVILELFFFGVLHDHALHDLEAAGHRSREEGVLLVGLHDLLLAVALAFVFSIFFHIISQISFMSVQVGVEDHPLGSLDGVDRGAGWVGLVTLLTEGQVVGLGSTFLVEELVTKGLLLDFRVSLI